MPMSPSITQKQAKAISQLTPSPNGKHSTLGERLKARLSPSLEVGSPGYIPDENHKSSSLADAHKFIQGIQWLVPGWVPRGMLTGVVAQSKMGKSAFVLDGLVRPLATGSNWFSGAFNSIVAPVIWCDTEGSLAINDQRAQDWEIPRNMIKMPFDDPLQKLCLEDHSHLIRLENVINYNRSPLAILDSFRGSHDREENNSRISTLLRKLSDISERTRASIVIIHHSKTLPEGEEATVQFARGSTAFIAMVRCQIVLDRPNKKSSTRRIRMLGENLGTKPNPIGFKYRSDNTGLEFTQAPEQSKPETIKRTATEWLLSRLKQGEWIKAVTDQEATDAGFNHRSIQSAREGLGIKGSDFVRKGPKHWEWMLPIKD